MKPNHPTDISLEEIIKRDINPEEVTPATPEDLKEAKENILLQAIEALNSPKNKN
jgi:hypothetical protein